jgi:menaquinone-dependent protoporphyrinogen IX oxidase
MNVEIYHASKYGNGEKVVAYLQGSLVAKGHNVNASHVRTAKPREVPAADLYVFCSPARMGKPIGKMRRFLKKLNLPEGSKYALIATLGQPEPDKKTGKMPTQEEVDRFQQSLPIMDEVLRGKGMTKVADLKVYVKLIKGPLEEGWEKKVEELAARLLS